MLPLPVEDLRNRGARAQQGHPDLPVLLARLDLRVSLDYQAETVSVDRPSKGRQDRRDLLDTEDQTAPTVCPVCPAIRDLKERKDRQDCPVCVESPAPPGNPELPASTDNPARLA